VRPRGAPAHTAIAAHPIEAQLLEAARGGAPDPWERARRVSVARLDTLRGGFDAGNGVQVSFGIERAAWVNGQLVTTQVLNFNTGTGSASGQASTTVGATVGMTQGLAQAVASTPLTPSALSTVIQNALNGQDIKTVTIVNATVNSVQMLRNLSMQNTLQNALIHSIVR